MDAKYFIGTSGFHYDHWKGVFYPWGLPKAKWLEFYAQHFSTLELNNSFYHLPSERAFTNWREGSPPGFLFTVKASRLITHLRKLRNIDEALANFLARARLLDEKLGPILFQLPPMLHRNPALLESFLEMLPRDLHHVFEFRHPSWFHPEMYALLERYQAAFCVFDMPGMTTPVLATADPAYVRFHGGSSLYASCYTDEELHAWAGRIEELGQGRDAVYIYFNNDAEGFAVQNAKTLMGLLAVAKV